MIDGKLGVRTAAWLMVACGLPSLAWAGDDDRLRPDRAQVHGARNDSGVAVTISSNGFIDQRNPFFRELGANGRSCVVVPSAAGRLVDHAARACASASSARRAWTRSFASTTAPIRRWPTSRRGRRARRPTACFSRRA